MPNHVTTRCIVTGPIGDVEQFRAAVICVSKEDDEVTLDFHQIAPMPEIFKESADWSNAELGIEILTGKPRPDFYNRSFLDLPWIQQRGISSHARICGFGG